MIQRANELCLCRSIAFRVLRHFEKGNTFEYTSDKMWCCREYTRLWH